MEWDEALAEKKKLLNQITKDLDETQVQLLTYLLKLEKKRKHLKDNKANVAELKERLASLIPDAD